MPPKLQATLQDCKSTDSIWERLDSQFPPNSIPQAILKKPKLTKSMSSNSAQEMRRVLEQVKTYARHAKEAGCA